MPRQFSLKLNLHLDDPKHNEHMSQWVKDYWKALQPYSAKAGYLNFNQEFAEDSIRNNYRDNFQRLQETKAKYDPDNIFHVNHNIAPKFWAVVPLLGIEVASQEKYEEATGKPQAADQT